LGIDSLRETKASLATFDAAAEAILRSGSSSAADSEPRYDVALSFAGERRQYVDRVAEALEKDGVAVFYDHCEVVNLWAGISMSTATATETIVFPAVDLYTIQTRLFAQAVLDDTPVPVPISDAIANMRVIEGILATSPML